MRFESAEKVASLARGGFCFIASSSVWVLWSSGSELSDALEYFLDIWLIIKSFRNINLSLRGGVDDSLVKLIPRLRVPSVSFSYVSSDHDILLVTSRFELLFDITIR